MRDDYSFLSHSESSDQDSELFPVDTLHHFEPEEKDMETKEDCKLLFNGVKVSEIHLIWVLGQS